MVFPTPQIYTYHIFQHSLFLSQQLNINKIRHSESLTQSITYQIIALLLCFKTHLTMLSFFLNKAFFRHFSCVFIIHLVVESSEAGLHQISTA
mgnify:FL=1